MIISDAAVTHVQPRRSGWRVRLEGQVEGDGNAVNVAQQHVEFKTTCISSARNPNLYSLSHGSSSQGTEDRLEKQERSCQTLMEVSLKVREDWSS